VPSVRSRRGDLGTASVGRQDAALDLQAAQAQRRGSARPRGRECEPDHVRGGSPSASGARP
jgi:hypothetical protein